MGGGWSCHYTGDLLWFTAGWSRQRRRIFFGPNVGWVDENKLRIGSGRTCGQASSICPQEIDLERWCRDRLHPSNPCVAECRAGWGGGNGRAATKVSETPTAQTSMQTPISDCWMTPPLRPTRARHRKLMIPGSPRSLAVWSVFLNEAKRSASSRSPLETSNEDANSGRIEKSLPFFSFQMPLVLCHAHFTSPTRNV
jgi:hypothetical protein